MIAIGGGYSLVEATLGMYQSVIDSSTFYDKIVLLSGLDYPIVGNEKIYQTLVMDKEFIMLDPDKESHSHKFMNLYDFDRPNFNKILSLLRKLGIKIKTPWSKYLIKNNLNLTFAPQWSALSNDCVCYILDFIKSNKNDKIINFFRHTYAPDELLIPTIIFNSRFSSKCLKVGFPSGTHYNNKCAIHYINYSSIVQTFSEDDYQKLIYSGKLFARKLETGKSDALIEMIDKNREEV